MACTIDHLRVEHHVTVLRDFTDLAGTTLPAGAAGVVRGLGADFAQMQMWIELEQGDTRHMLRFALRAPDGPRIGHMREYFEMGAPADLPQRPEPAPAAAPGAVPRGPQDAPPRYAAKPAPIHTRLGESRVACDCDRGFHRDLLPAGGGLSVAACLVCGTLTVSRSYGDDGRHTGNAWQEYNAIALPDPVHRWLCGWPRVRMDYGSGVRWPMSAYYVRYPTIFYPADARCANLAQLADLEHSLVRRQATLSRVACLRLTCRVKRAPPAGVPDELYGYVSIWEALQLGSHSDLAKVLALAHPGTLAAELAAEQVRERPGAFDIIADLLRSNDSARRAQGYAIARDMRPADARLVPLIVEQLQGLSFEPLRDVPQAIVSRGRCELLLLLIAEHALDTPELRATLSTLMRKFARHDPFLLDCTRIVLAELNAAPRAGR